MKPRLRRRDGIWECCILPRGRKGYGYSLADAYRDWLHITATWQP